MKIGIVGAGPCGLVMAMLLAQQGYEVDVYEKRSTELSHGSKKGRSYNIDLSYRALYTLSHLGLIQDVYAICMPIIGKLTYDKSDIAVEYYDECEHAPIYNTTRDQLHQLLLDSARQFNNIAVHFNHYVCHIDLDDHRLDIQDKGSGAVQAYYASKIIGCDGGNSLSRDSLSQFVPTNQFVKKQVCYYKQLHFPDEFVTHLQSFMHKWLGPDVSIVGHPNQDGTLNGTLLLSHPNPDQIFHYCNISEVQSILNQYFPCLAPYIDSYFCEQVLQTPLSHFNIAHVDQLVYKDRFLLIGDAAHTLLPFLGQGLNSSLEDCYLFYKALDNQHHAWDKALTTFNHDRQQDIQAISHITQQASSMFLPSLDSERSSVHVQDYMLRVLQQTWGLIPYQTYLYYSLLPYRYVYQLKQEQHRICMLLSDIVGGKLGKLTNSPATDSIEQIMGDYFDKHQLLTANTLIRRL